MMLRHQGTTMFVFSQAILAIYLLPALLKQAAAESDMDFKVSCPPQDITLSMAGLQSGNRLLGAWQKVYSSKYCPGFNITFESNSWDSAAARVCDSSLIDNPVDIASMGGSFFQPQATTSDGWTFQCMRSKLERETALVRLRDPIFLSYDSNV